MACVPAVKNLVNLQMDNYEHIITNTSTPLQRLGSIVRGQPLVEVNEQVVQISRSLARSISSLQRPVFDTRDTATVNMGAATEHGYLVSPNAFRRLTSHKSFKGATPRNSERAKEASEGPASSLSITWDQPEVVEAEGGTLEGWDREKLHADQAEAEEELKTAGAAGQEVQEEEAQASAGPPPTEQPANRLRSWTSGRRTLHTAMQAVLKQKPTEAETGLPDETRLSERLAKLQLKEVEQAGDGNCQFRAISHQLYNKPSWHLHVRKKVVHHMRQASDYFEGFLGEDFESYCEEMEEPGTWGDELTLRAAADCIGAKIHVLTSEPENWYMVYEPERQTLDRELFLTYISPIHYNSIERKSIGCSAQNSFSSEQHIDPL